MMSTVPALVDSHCHLDFPDFDGELPDLISRAQDFTLPEPTQ